METPKTRRKGKIKLLGMEEMEVRQERKRTQMLILSLKSSNNVSNGCNPRGEVMENMTIPMQPNTPKRSNKLQDTRVIKPILAFKQLDIFDDPF